MSGDLRGLHFDHQLAGVEPWRPPFKLPHDSHATLNDAHLLHLLATQPDRVLPPGKSLASVLPEATSDGASRKASNPLEEKISTMVKRAFWEEVGLSHTTQTPYLS